MAREIILIDSAQSADGNSVIATAVFWLIAPTNRVVPLSNFKSAVPLVAAVSWGVTAGELTALQAGTTVEQVFTSGLLPKAGLTVGAVETLLQNAYAAAQTALTAVAPGSKFIGSFWDGTTWTAAP